MNSLKQVIVNAVIKVSSDPMYAGREYASSDDARADFIKALIAELFPECPECVLPTSVQESDGGGVKVEPKKKAGRKPKTEAKVDAPTSESPAEPKVDAPTSESPVTPKKAGRKPKAAAPAAAGAGDPPAEKKKAGRKPKAPVEGAPHLDKWNPSQTKRFKEIAKELKVEGDKKAFQDTVNALTKDEFHAKTFDEHIHAFLSTQGRSDTIHDLTKCARVEWQGTEYLVDPETKKVYRPDGDVNVHVGHMGMLEFDGMEIPSA